MPTKQKNTYGEINLPHDKILEFIRENNGDAYRGDEETSRFIARAAFIVGIQDENRTLGGLALIDKTRLLTWTTSKTAHLGFESRAELGRVFMRECGKHAEWLTIGEVYTRALAVAAMSGLERVNDSGLASQILAKDGLQDRYRITTDHNDELIVETVGTQNRQQDSE